MIRKGGSFTKTLPHKFWTSRHLGWVGHEGEIGSLGEVDAWGGKLSRLERTFVVKACRWKSDESTSMKRTKNVTSAS